MTGDAVSGAPTRCIDPSTAPLDAVRASAGLEEHHQPGRCWRPRSPTGAARSAARCSPTTPRRCSTASPPSASRWTSTGTDAHGHDRRRGRADRPPGPARIDARLSGTTSRFLLPALAVGAGPYRLDGAAPLRARPMGRASSAVRALGAEVVESRAPRATCRSTVRRTAPSDAVGHPGQLAGDVSSQFLSGLLLAGPVPSRTACAIALSTAARVAALRRSHRRRDGGFGATVHRPDPSDATWSSRPATGRRTSPSSPTRRRRRTSSPPRRSPGGGCAWTGSAPAALQGDVRLRRRPRRMGAERDPGADGHRRSSGPRA